MTVRTSSKRSYTTSTEGSQSASVSSGSSRGEEKTIPFLRRLTDMLLENEEYISFTPGSRDKDILGKIIVHDRVKVESTILPRYFNHASFASLRRQLNYFSFTRISKGRQAGAVYVNDRVCMLSDILSLTRRSNSGAATTVDASKVVADEKPLHVTSPTTLKSVLREAVAPKSVVRPTKRIRTANEEDQGNATIHQTPISTNTTLPARVSPVDSLVEKQEKAPKRISLDLTGASSVTSLESNRPPVESVDIVPNTVNDDSSITDINMGSPLLQGDDSNDILAGCRALLCFSRGIPSN